MQLNNIGFIIKKYDESGKGFIRSGSADFQYENIGEGKYRFEDFTAEVIRKQYGEVVNQYVTVKNTSDKVIKLKQVSSGYIKDIGKGGIMPWYDERRFKIHYCFSAWQGECQWRSGSLSQLGLYRASNHSNENVISFRSVGNQTTSIYYPIVFIQDLELGKTWFFEIEAGGNWYMEIGADSLSNSLYVEMNSAFNNSDNWCVCLEANERYVSSPCICGVVDGETESAIKCMLDYKRKTSLTHFDSIPVCFNDYMNCLWAKPSDKKLISLIDKAALVGCEVFCIDDGWFKSEGHIGGNLGDYIANDERFGEKGFRGIIDYIISKGLKPGVWLELESITKETDAYGKFNDCLLKINGEYAGSNGRYLIDFRKEKVRQHFFDVIDRLYSLGIRFIKNDYNQTSEIGYDGRMSAGEEMRQCALAFYGFIDEVREKYKDLITENCGSGAMRSDGGIMHHFHMLSTSDQEYYYNNPSVVTGTMACIQPEKCGIWSYPYPWLYDDNINDKIENVFNDEYLKSFEDGEQTAYNMVTSMLGVMYLSGHIDYADDFNTKLICDAVSVYKTNRDFIKNAYPIYPNGFIKIDAKGFYSFGLTDGKKTILAVWRNKSLESTEIIDLSAYIDDEKRVSLIYPQNLPCEYSLANKRLTVKLNKPCSARIFEIV